MWGISAVAVLCCIVLLQLRRPTEVRRFEQPASVTYADGRQHVAVLWHIRTNGSAVGLGPDHYEVLLGSNPVHGHVVRLEATGFDPTDLDVSWEAQGARLTYGSGHEVFVPADSFLFGR